MSTRRRAGSTSLAPSVDATPGAVLSMAVNASSRAVSRSSKRTGSKRRKLRSYAARYKELSRKKSWLNPLIIMIAVVGFYCRNPTPENPAYPLLYLSYPETKDGKLVYGKGLKDLLFVAFYTVFFTFTREFIMKEWIGPLAAYCNIVKKAKVARFKEQVYTAMYFAIFGPFGLWVMYNTPIWYFRTEAFYEGYPHHTHDAQFKAYYLLQAAFWAQQMIVLVLQLEKPRKDFKEFVLHHFVTLSLISLSYRFHFTYIGIAVYITHDISDFFLATSKTLNYLDASFIGPYFGLFIASWIYMRHYLNLWILWSVLTQFRTIGPWMLDWDKGYYKCGIAQVITFGLLASLQAVNLFWLYLILKIAKRYVWPTESGKLEDIRSEDEDSENEADSKKTVDGMDEVEKKNSAPTLASREPVTVNGAAKKGL